MYRMYVDQTGIEPKILCRDCRRPAEAIFFDFILPIPPGITLHLRQLYGKCIEHLTFSENKISGLE
jgi:hypothetical protein